LSAARALALYPAQTLKARAARAALWMALRLRLARGLETSSLALDAEDPFVRFLCETAGLPAPLLRLAALTGEGRYRDLAETALRTVQPLAATYPTAFARWLCALDFALAAPREVAIVGDPTSAEVRALLEVLWGAYRPNQVVALARPGETPVVPLLEGRTALDGRATAFVCERFACRLPVTEPADLAAQLA